MPAQTEPRGSEQVVLMLLANPCNPDPRVEKEATTISDAGKPVTILAWTRGEAGLPPIERRGGTTIKRVSSAARLAGLPGRLLTAVEYWVATYRAAKQENAAVVHCHDLNTLPVGIALKFGGRRLVYDAHEMYWLLMARTQRPTVVTLLRWIEPLLLRFVDQVITVNATLADYYSAYHPRVSVVGNWYDPKVLAATERGQLRRELGIPDAAFCVGSVGILGPERLNRLLVEYARAFPHDHVVIAGRGAEEDELRSAAAGIPNLHFIGWRPDPNPVIAACNALFYGLATDDPYNKLRTPNNLYMSIALAVPLITTDVSESSLLIGRTGAGEVLKEPTVAALRTAIESLRDPRRSEEVKRLLVGLQDEYSWRRAAQLLLSVYEEVGVISNDSARRIPEATLATSASVIPGNIGSDRT